MKYIIMFTLSISFFCETYTSDINMVPVVESRQVAPLKPADKKRMDLKAFLSRSFKLDVKKIGTKQGRHEEAGRLIKESRFKGHVNVARKLLDEYLIFYGFDVAEPIHVVEPAKKSSVFEQGLLFSPVIVQQKDSDDRAIKMFQELRDKHGYPSNAYFDELIEYMRSKKISVSYWINSGKNEAV